jgi:hypothetical protein
LARVATISEQKTVAFVFVLAAGFTVGMMFDLFMLSLFCVPLYFATFIAMSHTGMIAAFLGAVEMAALLQLGYVAGLLLRGNLPRFAPIPAAEKQKRRQG